MPVPPLMIRASSPGLRSQLPDQFPDFDWLVFHHVIGADTMAGLRQQLSNELPALIGFRGPRVAARNDAALDGNGPAGLMFGRGRLMPGFMPVRTVLRRHEKKRTVAVSLGPDGIGIAFSHRRSFFDMFVEDQRHVFFLHLESTRCRPGTRPRWVHCSQGPRQVLPVTSTSPG